MLLNGLRDSIKPCISNNYHYKRYHSKTLILKFIYMLLELYDESKNCMGKNDVFWMIFCNKYIWTCWTALWAGFIPRIFQGSFGVYFTIWREKGLIPFERNMGMNMWLCYKLFAFSNIFSDIQLNKMFSLNKEWALTF